MAKRSRRLSFLWWVLVLGILALGGFWPFAARGPRHDSLSPGPFGKVAFFRLVQALHPETTRNLDSPMRLQDDVDTLCLLGPAQLPSRAQWDDLYDWVADGHSLLFAPSGRDPSVDLAAFGLTIRPESESSEIQTNLVTGEFSWLANAAISGHEPDEALVTAGSQAVVVAQQVGEGVVVVVASDVIFANAVLAEKDNGVLAYRLLEACQIQGAIVVEESLNQAGAPAVLGLLFGAELRLVTLQLLLLLVLFAWLGFYRFGRPVHLGTGTRRSFSEHARALGRLHWKQENGRAAVRRYFDYFRREVRLRSLRPADLARRAGEPEARVEQLLQVAQGSGGLSSAAAAACIRGLARLRRKLS